MPPKKNAPSPSGARRSASASHALHQIQPSRNTPTLTNTDPTPCVAAPAEIPDLPAAVMFKKRRLFRAIGARNAIITIVMMGLGWEVVIKRCPWGEWWFVALVVGAYWCYYWTVCAKKTNVYYGKSWITDVKVRTRTLRPLPTAGSSSSSSSSVRIPHGPHSDFIAKTLATIPTLKGRGYKPTFYLDNPSVQTVYATALRADPLVFYDRELVSHLYTDGEVCILDWSFSQAANDGWTSVTPPPPLGPNDPPRNKPAPVVVLFHGLTGGSDDANMHYTTHILNKHGFHVVIPVRRGCADAANLISRNKHYPYGDEADAALAVSYIAKKMSGHWLMGVGLSAGSNVLSIYLGTQGKNSKLRAAISVANGYDWNCGTKAIVNGNAFWSTLMSSMVQYNLLRRHDTDVFFTTGANSNNTSSNAPPPTVAASSDDTMTKGQKRANSAKRSKLSDAFQSRDVSHNNNNNHHHHHHGNHSTTLECHDLHCIRGGGGGGGAGVAVTPTTATGGSGAFPFPTASSAAAGESNTNNNNATNANNSTTQHQHHFIAALVESSVAAKRLVARTVTHTQLAATYLLGEAVEGTTGEAQTSLLEYDDDDYNDNDNANDEKDEEADEWQTTTPFPFPFDRDNFMKRPPPPPQQQKKELAAAIPTARRRSTAKANNSSASAVGRGQQKGAVMAVVKGDDDVDEDVFHNKVSSTSHVISTLYGDYYAFDPHTHHIRSSTMTDNDAVAAAAASSPSSAAPSSSVQEVVLNEQVAFEKAVRTGLRGRLNADFEKEQPRLFQLATAATATALTDTTATTTTSDDAAAMLQALRQHQREAVKRRYEQCADPVILKDHYAHIQDYDECVARRLHGFHDQRSFYDAQSCRNVIKDITVPTFFLNALDDPVASAEVVPYHELAANPNVCLITTPRGGHLGWADGLWPFTTRYNTWLERFITEVAVKVREEVEAGRL